MGKLSDLIQRLKPGGGRDVERASTQPYIVEAGEHKALHFSGLCVQSEMNVEDPNQLVFHYTQAMMGFLLFQAAPELIEMIGLGGGSLAKYCYQVLPDARITVAEISPEVIALREHFLIPPDDERFRICCADGAEFVRQDEACPDVLMVDGYDQHGQAPQLCSPAFYDDCYSRLAPGGVLVVNLWGSDRSFGACAARLRTSFQDKVLVIPVDEGTNKIAFAFKQAPFPPKRHDLLKRAAALEPLHAFSMTSIAQRMLYRLEHRKNRAEEPWCESY